MNVCQKEHKQSQESALGKRDLNRHLTDDINTSASKRIKKSHSYERALAAFEKIPSKKMGIMLSDEIWAGIDRQVAAYDAHTKHMKSIANIKEFRASLVKNALEDMNTNN